MSNPTNPPTAACVGGTLLVAPRMPPISVSIETPTGDGVSGGGPLSPPSTLPMGPPHQIIINSPSPESSPRSPRNAKRPSPITPEAMRNCLSISTGYDPHKLSPVSPMYPTSDLGSSPRSSISIPNVWTYREQKQRGSSSDFTDPDSDMAKDILSPGLMLSPAPFSPFSDCYQEPSEGFSSCAGSMTPAGGSSTACLSPRSTNHSSTDTSPCGSISNTPRMFHFNFDPTSLGDQHSSSRFLLPPSRDDDGSRERSSSDSEAICHSHNAPSDGTGDETRVRYQHRHHRSVKKRFLDRFISDQVSVTSSHEDERRSTSACGSLPAGIQVQLRIATPDDEEGLQIPSGSQTDSPLHTRTTGDSLSPGPPGGRHSAASQSPVPSNPFVPGYPPFRLSMSSMEIGGLAAKQVIPPPRTGPDPAAKPLTATASAPLSSPRHHVSLQKSNSTNPTSGVSIPTSHNISSFPQGSMLSQSSLASSGGSQSSSYQVANAGGGMITVAGGPHHGGEHGSTKAYFDWWLKHQVAMAPQLWASDHSAANPLFTPPVGPPTGGATPPLYGPQIHHQMHHTHILGPSRHFGIPYPMIKAQRSRSESDIAYVCSYCGQSFALHDRLAKHIASRHRDRSVSNSGSPHKTHKCAVCAKSFGRSDMLTRHMRLHTGVKPYACKICGQVFSRSDHLSTHLRTHTGEKPYGCPQCSYAASRRDMITRHMRTHAKAAAQNASLPGSSMGSAGCSTAIPSTVDGSSAAEIMSAINNARQQLDIATKSCGFADSVSLTGGPDSRTLFSLPTGGAGPPGNPTVGSFDENTMPNFSKAVAGMPGSSNWVTKTLSLPLNPDSSTSPVLPKRAPVQPVVIKGTPHVATPTAEPISPESRMDIGIPFGIQPPAISQQQRLADIGHDPSMSAFAPNKPSFNPSSLRNPSVPKQDGAVVADVEKQPD